jgi:lysophospholipase L1-like esterase
MKSLKGRELPWGYPQWIEQPQDPKTIVPTGSSEELALETTSHQIVVSDIKLIACIGDSLLAGLGVTAHPGNLKNRMISRLGSSYVALLIKWILSGEHRHNTCITGGARGVVSIGRLLKHYTPNLLGLTQKKTLLFSQGSSFNFARTGATSDQLLEQSTLLIRKLNKTQLQDEWKMVFVWIGANDAFGKTTKTIQETFESHLLQTLTNLRLSLKKTIVYILPLPNLCHLNEKIVTKAEAERLEQRSSLINNIVHQMVKSYKQDLDFRVKTVRIPIEPIPSESQVDLISAIDQIHPSFLAQQLFAKSIWNNLFVDEHHQQVRLKDVIQASWTYPSATTPLAL